MNIFCNSANTGYLIYCVSDWQSHELFVWRGGTAGGGMLDRLGIRGGTDAAERAGMTGGTDVEAAAVAEVVTGGMAFGLGGMNGTSFSPSVAAVFGAGGGTLSLRGIAGATASGLGARIGAGKPAELLTGGKAAATAPGLGAGTGAGGLSLLSGLRAGTWAIEVLDRFPADMPGWFPDGSTPTGRLAGRGGGGPRPANPGGRAGGMVDGGGIKTFSASLTESWATALPKWFMAEASAPIVTVSPIDLWVGSVGGETSAFVSKFVSLWFLIKATLGSVVSTL